MKKVDIETLVKKLETSITKSEMSCYEMANTLNVIIIEMKIEIKPLRPQMLYTYCLPTKQYIKQNQNGFVSKEEIIRWFVKYISKKNLEA